MREEYKENLRKILLNENISEIQGIYEPPNNIPIIRYKVKKENYKVIVIGDDARILSCIRWLKTEDIEPKYIVSNNFNSKLFKIIRIEQLQEVIGNEKFYVIITSRLFEMPVYRQNMIKFLNALGINEYIYLYEYEKMPLHDKNFLEYFINNEEKLYKIIDMLEDEESVKTYIEYIRAYENLDFYRLTQHKTIDKYFDTLIYKHLPDECFVNCGSSNGDSIFYFLEKFNYFEKIYAIEPDKYRMDQFNINKKILPEEIQNKIETYNNFLGDGKKENNMDEFLKEKKVTLINMDIEGVELNALNGAKDIIKKQKPVLAICAYHLASDLIDLPNFAKSLSDDYHIFFKKYASTFRNKFRTAELVMYAVPTNRLVK